MSVVISPSTGLSRRDFIAGATIGLLGGVSGGTIRTITGQRAVEFNCVQLHELIRRVLASSVHRFVCDLIPSEGNHDVFEYETGLKGKIFLRSNNPVSLAVAFNQYLRRETHMSYDWQAVAPLSPIEPLSAPKRRVRRTCFTQERFLLNYCTYGYTFPYWKWNEWERLLDWMALNGINRPLLQTGQEAVWLRVWQSYGMTADQVRAYFSGPAHLPWHRMANLDSYGGPLPLSYIEGQQKLQKQILIRAREFGMKPILSGFAGHVPRELIKLRPQAKISPIKPGWGGLSPEFATYYLDPTDPLFADIQKKFLDEQEAMYGSDHLYAADPFNEMEPPSWEPEYLATVSKAIWEGMVAADPQARWYQMAWTFSYDKRWTKDRIAALFSPVPANRMVLLDYACEEVELYRKTKAFFGRAFVWNYLGNFGGRTHLLAPLESLAQKIRDVHEVPNCVGVGSTLEGLNVNPVIYDMVFELPWQSENAISTDAWIRDYAIRRAGHAEPAVIEAWQLLVAKVLKEKSVGKDNGSIFQVYPSFTGKDGWTRPSIAYAEQDLVRALELMLQAGDQCRSSDGYAFDVVNLTRQVLCNHGLRIYNLMIDAYGQKDMAVFKRESSRFLELGKDLDELLGTRHEFLLGPWLAQARRWGRSSKEADYYESNAREIITCWHQVSNGLRDYASRQWNGLLHTYYLPRWKKFIDTAEHSLETNEPFDEWGFKAWTKDAASHWIRTRGEDYLIKPQGEPVATSKRVFHKYRKEITKPSMLDSNSRGPMKPD